MKSLVESRYEDLGSFMIPTASERTEQPQIHQREPSQPRKIILGSKEPLTPGGWEMPCGMVWVDLQSSRVGHELVQNNFPADTQIHQCKEDALQAQGPQAQSLMKTG